MGLKNDFNNVVTVRKWGDITTFLKSRGWGMALIRALWEKVEGGDSRVMGENRGGDSLVMGESRRRDSLFSLFSFLFSLFDRWGLVLGYPPRPYIRRVPQGRSPQGGQREHIYSQVRGRAAAAQQERNGDRRGPARARARSYSYLSYLSYSLIPLIPLLSKRDTGIN
jgi:hypothetical protein